MTCQEFEELSAAYALGAVTPEEHQAVRAHLATCPKCTRLAGQLRSIVDLLPLSVAQVSPPAALRDRVLAAVQQEGRVVPIERGAQIRARKRKPAWGWGTRLLATAAIVLLMLTGAMTAWNVSLQQRASTLQQQTTQLGSRVAALQSAKNTLQREVAQVYAMQGQGQAQTTTGSLIYIPQKNITLLYLHGLPELQGSHLYQGWLIHNNKPTSIGTLSIQNGVASLTFSGNVTGFDVAAVSLEPGPHASANAPSGPVIVTGSLQHPVETLYTI
ncbi:MAG TPA: anti-sigma factor [Ktedonobacteraceae bacterium]